MYVGPNNAKPPESMRVGQQLGQRRRQSIVLRRSRRRRRRRASRVFGDAEVQGRTPAQSIASAHTQHLSPRRRVASQHSSLHLKDLEDDASPLFAINQNGQFNGCYRTLPLLAGCLLKNIERQGVAGSWAKKGGSLRATRCTHRQGSLTD